MATWQEYTQEAEDKQELRLVGAVATCPFCFQEHELGSQCPHCGTEMPGSLGKRPVIWAGRFGQKLKERGGTPPSRMLPSHKISGQAKLEGTGLVHLEVPPLQDALATAGKNRPALRLLEGIFINALNRLEFFKSIVEKPRGRLLLSKLRELRELKEWAEYQGEDYFGSLDFICFYLRLNLGHVRETFLAKIEAIEERNNGSRPAEQ